MVWLSLLRKALDKAVLVIPLAFLGSARAYSNGELVDCVRFNETPTADQMASLVEIGFIPNHSFHLTSENESNKTWLIRNKAIFDSEEELNNYEQMGLFNTSSSTNV